MFAGCERWHRIPERKLVGVEQVTLDDPPCQQQRRIGKQKRYQRCKGKRGQMPVIRAFCIEKCKAVLIEHMFKNGTCRLVCASFERVALCPSHPAQLSENAEILCVERID